MDFFEAVKKRRSIRKFLPEAVPESIVRDALEAAILAPNSSNTQTWHFYWPRNIGPKERLIKYCLNQAAARTAAHLIVVTADPKLWKRSHAGLLNWVDHSKAPRVVSDYYRKLIPFVYRWGIFNSLGILKHALGIALGIFRTLPRGPYYLGGLQEVAIKSAALAAENFVLAITAQGYSTCMMEGFDEVKVKRLLKMPYSARVVMVIAVGKESDRGTWGSQWRLPVAQVLTEL